MRPLYTIARDIRKDWTKVNYAAKPYLDAMSSLSSINDAFHNALAVIIVKRIVN